MPWAMATPVQPPSPRCRPALGFLAAACLAVSPASAQVAPQPDSAAVVAAARRWVAILDRGRYAESLDSAAPLLRQMTGTTDAWKALADRARAGFPASPERTVVAFDPAPDLPGAPAGHYVRVTFRVSTGSVIVAEIVVLQETPPDWRVAMYGTRPG